MTAKLRIDQAAFERDVRALIALEDHERRRIAADIAIELRDRLEAETPRDTGETARSWDAFGVDSDRRLGISWIRTRNRARGAIWGIYAGATVRPHQRRSRKGPVTVRGYRRVTYGSPSERRRFVLAEQTRAAVESYERMRATGVFDAP